MFIVKILCFQGNLLRLPAPPDYIFVDGQHPFNRKELGVHIGNAVPVLLGKAIGISINRHLEEMGVK